MIKLLGNIPKNLVLAVSGGVDSMAMLDFLSRKHQITCAFFHHGTENSENAFQFIQTYTVKHNIKLLVGKIEKNKEKGMSKEEHWRNERYRFLDHFDCVATAHNLDDCVETWIWSSMHGQSSLIPYNRNNVIRPFLLNRKTDLIKWCIDKNVPWIEDDSNKDLKYTRNYIRHKMMPHALAINPGIHKLISKKLLDRQKTFK
jgi:tRNA(Ile)-lysidine synthase